MDLTPYANERDEQAGDSRLTPGDWFNLALKALVERVPGFGPVIKLAVWDRYNELRAKRLFKFVEELRSRLESLSSDQEFVRDIRAQLERDERFVFFLRHCFEKLLGEGDSEMFEAYKEAFFQGFANRQLSLDIKLEFLENLSRVRAVGLHVLGNMASKPLSTRIIANNIVAEISDNSEFSQDLILAATDTLANLQFIKVGRIAQTPQGELIRGEYDYCITNLGWAFIEFIGCNSSPVSGGQIG